MSSWNVLKTGIVIASLAVALPAAAQTAPANHGYVVGFGGGTSTEIVSANFGGNVGINVARDLVIFAEVSRTIDLQPKFTREDLALVDAAFAELGVPSSSTVKVPANFYTGGVRYMIPMTRPVRPYIAASGGVAHMSPKPNFSVLGFNLTNDMMSENTVHTSFRENTRPLASLGAGVTVTVVKHLQFDAGYKFSRIFVQTDFLQDYLASPTRHDRIDTHRAYAGLGVAF